MFATFFWNVGISQNAFDGLKVIYSTYDSVNKISVIPDSIFKRDVDILLLTYPFDTTSNKVFVGYEIRWPSIYIDGSLILTITKKQIYLRSGHENPNPNYLYWLINITDEQYKIINKKIRANKDLFEKVNSEFYLFEQLYYKKFKPEKSIPKKWTNKKQEQYYQDCLQKRYENLDNLIAFLNNGLIVDEIIPFLSKEDFEKNKPVRIAFSEEDYDGQIKMIKIGIEK